MFGSAVGAGMVMRSVRFISIYMYMWNDANPLYPNKVLRGTKNTLFGSWCECYLFLSSMEEEVGFLAWAEVWVRVFDS